MALKIPIVLPIIRSWWVLRGLAVTGLLVLGVALLVLHPLVETDPGEMAVWLTSLLWVLWTGYATAVNWGIWFDLCGEEQPLKAIALRRVKNQAFQTSAALLVWIGTTITLFYPTGEAQGAMRTYTLVVAAVLFSYRSVLDHMEQRSVDTQGIESERPILRARRAKR